MNPNCTHTDLLLQNYSNFNKSSVPAKLMFYDNGSWFDFDADVADNLRGNFFDRTAVVELTIDGVDCLFDFYRMLQVRLDGGDQRSLAWIDVNRKCFFPKRFIDGNGKFEGKGNGGKGKAVLEGNCSGFGPTRSVDGNKKVNSGRIEVKQEGNGKGNGDGKVNGNGKVNGCGRITGEEVVSARWPKARVLRESEKAYETVKSLFMGGIVAVDPGARVTGIHQVVRPGPLDQARVEVFRKQMEILGANRGGANMTFAWHGASEKDVEVILRYGFSEVRKVEGDEGCGVGVYLSPVRLAHLSARLSEVDDNGEKHVILCRVLLGKCEKVEAGSQQMYPSSIDFDSGVDDLENPKWFVVWGTNMNTHIVPECVVSYRPSNRSPGKPRASPVLKSLPNLSTLFAKLLPKLGTSLPSSRVQEFQTLCSAYKEGKMAKDYFVKQLRSVVGDELLVSAIREVRG